MIKQVRNSLTVHDNWWTLKFDNFSKLQNVISDSAPTLERHYGALVVAPNYRASLWRIAYKNLYVIHSKTIILVLPVNWQI